MLNPAVVYYALHYTTNKSNKSNELNNGQFMNKIKFLFSNVSFDPKKVGARK